MKSIKPFLSVLAGMAIAFSFSFKSEEPKKEYLKLIPAPSGSAYIIIYDNAKTEKIESEKLVDQAYINYQSNQVKIANKLAKEGWVLSAAKRETSMECLYFERTKP